MDALEQMVFRLAEELRIRRKICLELDEKIKNLMNEVHKHEKLSDEKEQKYKLIVTDYERQIIDLKRVSQEKFLELESKQLLLKSALDVTERELSIVKEEVCKLKLEKYNFERKCDVLERKMQTNMACNDAQTASFANCQQRCQSLQSTMKQLFDQVRRLSSSVEQSKKFHGDLEKLCSHKDCQLKFALERENATTNALIKLQAELICMQISNQTSVEVENGCKQCNDSLLRVQEANRKIEAANDELEATRNEITKLVGLLSTSQEIVQKELSSKETAENELIKCKREMNEMQKRFEVMRKEMNEKNTKNMFDVEQLDENSAKQMVFDLKNLLEKEKDEKSLLEQNLLDMATKEVEYQNIICQLQAEINIKVKP